MALYLGENKISPTIHSIYEKTISGGTTTYNIMSQLEDPSDIYNKRDNVITPWTRPAGWPNLDAITIDDSFEGVYLTFDNDADLPYHLACFYGTISGGSTYTIETGYLNSSNQFVASKTETVNHNAYIITDYSTMSSTTYPYVVLRIKPINANQHFTLLKFGRIPVANSGTIVQVEAYKNFCLERRGKLKWVNNVVNSSTNTYYCTYYMQKDATVIGVNNPITGGNFASAWAYGINLREIDFTGWDTAAWTITSLSNVFYLCNNIEFLDLSCWNTSNWAITTLANTFYYCRALKYLNIANWDTHNWVVTSLSGTWSGCRNLLDLNINAWNVSQWAVNTLASTWQDCRSLTKLDLSNWNTTNWVVTSLAYTWQYCSQLVELNIPNFITTNWKITTMIQTWYCCYMLRDLSQTFNWDTSQWTVTNLQYTWGACYHLQILDLSGWVTSSWKVTTLYGTWYYCIRLHTLKIGTWNVSQWAVTTIYCICYSCYALKIFEAFQWSTPAWKITTIESAFRYCYSLKEINFTNWNCSQWALTTMAAFCSECNLMEKLDMSNINIASITTANNYGTTSSTGATTILTNCQTLKIFNPPSGWKGRIYLSSAYSLPREEVVKFFNNLVDNTGNTAIAFVIGAMRSQLTAADIAIATNKNYTIS